MSKVTDKMAGAIAKPVNRAAIVILGAFTAVWGLWVSNPFWEVFSRAPLYDALNSSGPPGIDAETFWGGVALICDLFVCYGAICKERPAILLGSAIIGWVWAVISVMYFLGDWRNTGGITSGTLSIYGWFIFLNVLVNK